MVAANSPEDIAAMNKLAVAYNNTASALKATEARFAEVEHSMEKALHFVATLRVNRRRLNTRGLAEAINFCSTASQMEIQLIKRCLFLESIDICNRL
ncbi:MAG: hypothetical protein R3C28_27805 [Pirellulaceae bacterium]